MSPGMEMYGLGRQANDGNNVEPQPSWVGSPIERAKWNSWEDCQGMTKVEAREQFLKISIPVLKYHGIPLGDPNKQILETAYDKCVQDKQAAGTSLDEIKL